MWVWWAGGIRLGAPARPWQASAHVAASNLKTGVLPPGSPVMEGVKAPVDAVVSVLGPAGPADLHLSTWQPRELCMIKYDHLPISAPSSSANWYTWRQSNMRHPHRQYCMKGSGNSLCTHPTSNHHMPSVPHFQMTLSRLMEDSESRVNLGPSVPLQCRIIPSQFFWRSRAPGLCFERMYAHLTVHRLSRSSASSSTLFPKNRLCQPVSHVVPRVLRRLLPQRSEIMTSQWRSGSFRQERQNH